MLIVMEWTPQDLSVLSLGSATTWIYAAMIVAYLAMSHILAGWSGSSWAALFGGLVLTHAAYLGLLSACVGTQPNGTLREAFESGSVATGTFAFVLLAGIVWASAQQAPEPKRAVPAEPAASSSVQAEAVAPPNEPTAESLVEEQAANVELRVVAPLDQDETGSVEPAEVTPMVREAPRDSVVDEFTSLEDVVALAKEIDSVRTAVLANREGLPVASLLPAERAERCAALAPLMLTRLSDLAGSGSGTVIRARAELEHGGLIIATSEHLVVVLEVEPHVRLEVAEDAAQRMLAAGERVWQGRYGVLAMSEAQCG